MLPMLPSFLHFNLCLTNLSLSTNFSLSAGNTGNTPAKTTAEAGIMSVASELPSVAHVASFRLG